MPSRDTEIYRRVQDKDNSFSIRVNPWDEKALGFRVTEVLDMKYTDVKILEMIDEENARLGAKLCCMRHQSGDIRAKRDLMSRGFYPAESSVRVSALLKKIKSRKCFEFRPAESRHIEALHAIAASDFRYSRFHEDPFIEPGRAVTRYINWVSDLVEASKCLVAEGGENDLVGFFSYKVDDEEVDLVLAGISSRHRGYGLLFFSSVIEHVKPLGKTVSALVSVANIDVLNVYINLGFGLKQSYIDYHKRY